MLREHKLLGDSYFKFSQSFTSVSFLALHVRGRSRGKGAGGVHPPPPLR